MLLLPLALVVGAMVGFATLGVHQDAVRPASASTSAHASAHSGNAAASWHGHGLPPAVQYFRVLAHHLHL